jgi:hypothetical protein
MLGIEVTCLRRIRTFLAPILRDHTNGSDLYDSSVGNTYHNPLQSLGGPNINRLSDPGFSGHNIAKMRLIHLAHRQPPHHGHYLRQ